MNCLETIREKNYSTYDEFGNPKVNKAANLTAHALLGAAIAIAQGNSALAGGVGALAGEAAADFIREKLYNKDVKDLSEAEKENISALAQLAVGLTVAAGTGGNTNDIGTAVAGSKNAVENNYLDNPDKSSVIALEYIKETKGLTKEEQSLLLELKIKDETSTNNLLVACVDVKSEACNVERKKAFDAMSTYQDVNFTSKKDLSGYREIDRLLKETSQEGDLARAYHEAYKNAYVKIGYSEEKANLMAAHTMTVQLLSRAVGTAVTLPTLNKVFSNNKLANIGKENGATQITIDKNKFLIPDSPGITQSRVNVANVTYDNGKVRGFEYAMGKHGVDSSVPNKSRFVIANDEVKVILQRPDVVNKPVYNPVQVGGKVETDKFVRQVDVGKTIGIDQSGKNTSIITIITDKKGNLINTFPGKL